MSDQQIIYIRMETPGEDFTRKRISCEINGKGCEAEISILDANPIEVAVQKLYLSEFATPHLINVITSAMAKWIREELVTYLDNQVELLDPYVQPIHDVAEIIRQQYETGEQN